MCSSHYTLDSKGAIVKKDSFAVPNVYSYFSVLENNKARGRFRLAVNWDSDAFSEIKNITSQKSCVHLCTLVLAFKTE